MKSRTSSLLRFLLLIAISCSTVGIAHAGNTIIPFYTGDFFVTNYGSIWSQGLTQVGGDLGWVGPPNPNFEVINIAFSAPITNFQETPWCGYYCLQYFTGNLDSGSVSFYGSDQSGQNPDYNFSGYILAGGTLSGEIVCEGVGLPCDWDNYVTVSFRSQSGSNGWYSTGNLTLSGGCADSGCANDGGLSIITRATPEASSISFFGSGVLGLAGMLRRKFLS